jgi:hypothetical protein
VTDPRRLQPGNLCRLLNSTPLGEVIGERVLRAHRTRAGLRIGDGKHIDLIRYLAWLIQTRHAPKTEAADVNEPDVELDEAAEAAVGIGSKWKKMEDFGPKLTTKQEALIAALLTERTHAAAARKADVGQTTLYRWMHLPEFRTAYRQARRELVEAAVGRIQAGSGHAVDALIAITRKGRRDGDRIRAAVALLDRAIGGLADSETVHGRPEVDEADPLTARDLVTVLSARLRQIEKSELHSVEQTRLMTALSDALIRALSAEEFEQRLSAVETIINERGMENRK